MDNYKLVIKTKSDIIDCIKQNISDGEVLDSIISSLERTIAKSIAIDHVVTIPYIGSIGPNYSKMSVLSNAKTLQEAAKNLTKDEFIVFRKQLSISEQQRLDRERRARYLMAMYKNRYKLQYRKRLKAKGELNATLYCYFLGLTVSVSTKQDYYYIKQNE